MSEAEKKWEEFDYQKMQDYWNGENGFIPEDDPDKISKVSREAYKQALREEIEKRKKHLTEMVKAHLKGTDVWAANENRLRELQIFEALLDTVEP